VQLTVNVFSAQSIITAFGVVGILTIVFIETGLLVGFFLPGDSLLFLAGMGASGTAGAVLDRPELNLPLLPLLIGTPLCAIAGAQLGHLLGARVGRRLFERPDSRLFKRRHLERAEAYFVRFGAGPAVVLARFIPVVRTFLNPVAGVLGMPAGKFFLWNVVGGTVWPVTLLLLGYRLGSSFRGDIEAYVVPISVGILVVSFLPMAVEIIRMRRRRSRAEDGQAVRPMADEML